MRRSLLFIPGNAPGLLANAPWLGEDAVIFDLEDAVPPAEKDAARILVRNALEAMDLRGCGRIVRINALDTEFWRQDVDELVPRRPELLLLPKAGSAADIRTADAYLTQAEDRAGLARNTVGLLPLIETALGVENAYAVATASPRVAALLLGAEDLTASLRCRRTREGREIEYARARLVTAARAADIEVYDTPFPDVNDDEGLRADALAARALGFTGKAAISPRHIEAINEIFSPARAEIDYAREVLEALRLAREQGRGAVALRGKMLDAPIEARARQVLALAEEMGLERSGGQ